MGWLFVTKALIRTTTVPVPMLVRPASKFSVPSSPHSNHAAVGDPFGFTMPLNVTLEPWTGPTAWVYARGDS